MRCLASGGVRLRRQGTVRGEGGGREKKRRDEVELWWLWWVGGKRRRVRDVRHC